MIGKMGNHKLHLVPFQPALLGLACLQFCWKVKRETLRSGLLRMLFPWYNGAR